jgi:hypothetical protein
METNEANRKDDEGMKNATQIRAISRAALAAEKHLTYVRSIRLVYEMPGDRDCGAAHVRLLENAADGFALVPPDAVDWVISGIQNGAVKVLYSKAGV